MIRPATATDIPLVLSFIRELADYEKLAHEVTATVASLRKSLFGPRRGAEAVIGFWQRQAVGFALYFHNFSTFVGRQGLYLEDLYVKPEYRGRGFGEALLRYVARIAKERRCGRFEWAALDWNRPAIQFYKKLGAVAMDDWTIYRTTGVALQQLAESPKRTRSHRAGSNK